MKKLGSLLLTVIYIPATCGLSSPVIPSISTTIAGTKSINRIGASFRTAWQYFPLDDTFTNREVTGGQWWQASMMNIPDETGASVTDLTLSLESAQEFDILKDQNLLTKGPPVYKWSFGDVQEGSGLDAWVSFERDPNPFPVTFTPGFDASRTIDKTEFSEPDTQTLTITVTPRETVEGLAILIQAFEDEQANPVITSPSTGEGIELSPDRRTLQIHPVDLDLNIPWNITVTIDVTPKASEAVFVPYVLVSCETIIDSGISDQRSFSHPVGDPADGIGKWIWNADGDYQWDWQETLSRQVIWRFRQEGPSGDDWTYRGEGNRIGVNFINEFHYEIPGDIFINSEVIGDRWWRSNFMNDADETGEPIQALRLSLTSNQRFDGQEPEHITKMGPPSYEWFLGDAVEEPEREGWPWDAFVTIEEYPAKFAPGLDVSRHFDQTEFSQSGTQTLTITITPREEWVHSIDLYVHTYETELVASSVVSYSSESEGNIVITPDGYRSGMYSIPMETETPVTITILLHVEPKGPPIRYTPYTAIYIKNPGQLAAGITHGDSISYENGAGIWTWSAQGDYVWIWQETSLEYSVEFRTRTEQLSDGLITESVDESPVEESSPRDENTTPTIIVIVVGIVSIAAFFTIWRKLKNKAKGTIL